MTFNEMVLATEKETQTFDKLFEQCVMFAEASYQEYKTNLKEAELKVIQESGTPEDLIYLENAAKEGFLVRTGKTLKKIIDSFLTWLKNIIESIQSFLNKKENKEALEKAEKLAKENPKLKSEKIEVTDIKKMERIYDKHEAMINKKIAMFKAKKFSANDMDDLDEIEKSYNKEKAAAKKVTVSLSIAAAITMIGYVMHELTKQQTDATKVQNITIDPTGEPDQGEAMLHGIGFFTRLGKEKATDFNKFIIEIFNNIKGKLTKSKEIDTNIGNTQKSESKKEDKKEKTTTESTTDESTYLDNLISEIEESATDVVSTESETTEEFDAEAYLEALEASLPELENEVIESTESSNELEKYLEALEKEICGEENEPVVEESTAEEIVEESTEAETVSDEEYLEAMEAELFGEEETVTTESEEQTITPEEYLVALEAELFKEDNKEEEVVEMTATEYLESLEARLFGEE